MPPESKVKIKIRRWLFDNMPGLWLYSAPGGAFGRGGTPDYIGCWLGIFIGLEIKAETGYDLSALQLVQLRKIEAAGGVAAVCKGYDVARLQAVKQAVLDKCKTSP